MNKLFLWLVSLFHPLLRRLGADPNAVHLILKAKLLMDDRGGMMMGQRQQRKKGMEYMTFIFIGLLGVLLVGLFSLTDHTATAVGIGFSIWMLFIGMMLITEMSENLFDQRDLYVLMSRPINDLTLSVSRFLHIAVFAAKFGLCLGLPSFVYFLVKGSIYLAFVYALLGVLTVIVTMTGTLVCYLVLLQRVRPARVKKIVGYFQIVATFFLFMAYQLPSLMGDITVLQNITLVGRPAGFLFPGLWLGGLFEAMSSLSASALAYAQGVLALAAAVGGLWFYVKQSRGYADRLLQMRVAGSEAKPETTAQSSGDGKPVAAPVREFLAGLLTRPNEERVSFRFHWNVMLRDMNFKQRTYPTLVYMPVILGITMFRDVFSGESAFSFGNGMVIMLLYFALWLLVVPLAQTRYSEQYRAAWIFDATANAYPTRIRYGQFAAVAGMFFLPTALLAYAVVLLFGGLNRWADVLLAPGATLLIAMVYNQLDGSHPFSRPMGDAKFSGFGSFMLVVVMAGAFGLGHYGLQRLSFGVPVAAVVVWAIFLAWVFYLRRDKFAGAAAGAG